MLIIQTVEKIAMVFADGLVSLNCPCSFPGTFMYSLVWNVSVNSASLTGSNDWNTTRVNILSCFFDNLQACGCEWCLLLNGCFFLSFFFFQNLSIQVETSPARSQASLSLPTGVGRHTQAQLTQQGNSRIRRWLASDENLVAIPDDYKSWFSEWKLPSTRCLCLDMWMFCITVREYITDLVIMLM